MNTDNDKLNGISPDVRDDLTAGDAVLAERITQIAKADADAVKVSANFADRVMAALTKTRVHGLASSRYEKMITAEHRRFSNFVRAHTRFFSMTAAAAAVLLVLSAYWVVKTPPADRMLVAAVMKGFDPKVRHQQRMQAEEFIASVIDGRADVSGYIPDGPVYLVGQRDDQTGEVCIFAYRPDQWKALTRLGEQGDQSLKDVWALMRDKAKVSAVDKGELGIPEDLWTDYLDHAEDASVLSFKDRNEFWNPENLQDYKRGTVIIKPDPTWGNL